MIPTTITCLGHGGAFADSTVGNTAYLVDHGEHRILVDCGGTVPHVLKEFGVDPASLTAILITHLHGDHVNGLEQILYHRHYVSKAPSIPLIMGPLTQLDWLDSVRATRTGIANGWFCRLADPTPWTPDDMRRGQRPIAGGVSVEYFKVDHGGDITDMACYAFLLELGSSAVFFSGDRVWRHDGDTAALHAMRHADVAFHELELFSPPSEVHTNIADVFDYRLTLNIWWGHHGSSSRTVEAAPHLKLTRKGDKWRMVGRHVDHEPLDWANPANY